jgi:DNA polymerase III delta subunit
MIYLFYGPNKYSRHKKILSFIKAVLDKYPQTAVGKFYLDEEGEIESLYEFLSTKTLFESKKRAAWVKNSKEVKNVEVFEKILSSLTGSKESVLILDEDWQLQETPQNFLNLIKNNQIKSFYFPALNLKQSLELILKESKNFGVKIDFITASYLFKILGSDIQACINEIEKLSFLGQPISLKLLEFLGDYKEVEGINSFSRAFFGAKIAEKLRLWEILLEQKTNPYAVFNYLAKVALTSEQIKKVSDIDLNVKRGLAEIDQAILYSLLT